MAQGLEHDIAAFGKDIEQAKRALLRTVSGYIEMARRSDQPPFASLGPAPDSFWLTWEKATRHRELMPEPMPMPGQMIPAVTYDPVPTSH